MDNCQLGLPLKTREGKWEEPISTKTRLGWVIHGRRTSPEETSLTHYHIHICQDLSNTDMIQLVKQYFSTENFGVEVERKEQTSHEEIRATDQLLKTTKKKNGFYETGLLWRSDQIKLPPSLEIANSRFHCLERRIKKD